ncbi:MAG TPA: 4-alpha-glucanotransferase, partial [Bacteroidetes bacterium]|nr:4-alpha-glucanotransferase [Bacteroidota bacterium]
IPAHEETAVNGRWVPAPGRELFETLGEKLGGLPLVAEDLGVITPDVTELRKTFGLPGMKVLQFAWDSGAGNPFLPHNHERDSIVYTGTHDNNTTLGWWREEIGDEARGYLSAYVGHEILDPPWELLRLAYASVGAVAVAPMQDLLRLGPEARMNTPAAAAGNWSWRLCEGQLEEELARRLRESAGRYGRLPGA